MNAARHPRCGGFTLIELMVVVALAAILLAVAAPSFQQMIARNRVEGVAGELSTDLQYARSEAVARNTQVGVIAGANCYTVFVVHPVNAAASCTNLNGGVAIKSVIIDAATISLAFAPTPPNTNTYIQFDPVRGMASNTGGADWSGSMTVSTSVGNWELRADVTNFGRARACSPSGTFKGYPSCT